jgi:hypothetical protein
MTTVKVTPSVDGNGEILVPFDLHSAIAELDKMLPKEYVVGRVSYIWFSTDTSRIGSNVK